MSSAASIHESPVMLHPHPPKPEARVLSFLLKVVIMFFITSLFFLLLGIASLILLPIVLSSIHRHRRNRSFWSYQNELYLRRIKQLPQFRFSLKKNFEQSDFDCVVCLEGFKQGQWCRRLDRCLHVFHRCCIDKWLVKVDACPICRARVLGQDEFVNNDAVFWASSWRRWNGSSDSMFW